jgi:hypothetical protein
MSDNSEVNSNISSSTYVVKSASDHLGANLNPDILGSTENNKG